MTFTFRRGTRNVHYLTAPYDLLVKAFGDDGLWAPRDEDKELACWKYGTVTVYDSNSVCQLSDVTDWHVQGSEKGLAAMLELLRSVSADPEPALVIEEGRWYRNRLGRKLLVVARDQVDGVDTVAHRYEGCTRVHLRPMRLVFKWTEAEG